MNEESQAGACGDYSGAVGMDSRLPNCSMKDHAFTWNGIARADHVKVPLLSKV